MVESKPVGEANEVSPDEEMVNDGVRGDADAAESPDVPAEDPIQTEIVRLQQEAGQLRELYLRKLADFDNFRKRKDKEMADFRRQSNADLLRDLLPVVDNLERALASGGADTGGVRAGVELTLKQFKDILVRHGVAEVDPEGQPFDPTQHEAVSRLHTVEAEPNTVIQVLQKGYRLGDRLLRAAFVVVAASAPPARNAPAGEEPGEAS